MKRILFALLAVSAAAFAPTYALAEEPATLEGLKKRVEDLENRMKEREVTDELGHKLHPIHSVYGLKVSGGVTLTAQGTSSVKGAKQRGDLVLSADIALESPVGKDGRAVVVFDHVNGAGPKNITLLKGPNGNPTGINADAESFNNTLTMTQAYYEHKLGDKATISIGKLDLTGYFDANEYANNERTQFLANIFVNNPAIEFGGSADFYGPGIRLTCAPAENVEFSLGAFEGDGDFVDTFDSPFLIAEVDLKAKPGGREGNYRFYYWTRSGRTGITDTANPADDTLAKKENSGAGFSIDQAVTDSLGLWARAGFQKENVAQFDKSVSAGVHLAGLLGRDKDAAGFGLGATFIGNDYKEYQRGINPDFNGGNETYMELYYSIAVDGAEGDSGLHITPDVQYIVNPGGDKDANNLLIYGVRLHAFF